MVGNAERITQFPYLVQLQIIEAEIDRDGAQFKRMGIETPQSLQGIEQRQAVFSSGDTDCDPVTGLYHMIIINGFSCKAVYLL